MLVFVYYFFRYRLLPHLALGLLILFWISLSKSAAAVEIATPTPLLSHSSDKLAYVLTSPDNAQTLMLYDAKTATKTPILSNRASIRFSFSVDGRLAYAESDSRGQIYVLDTKTTNNLPLSVRPSPGIETYPLAWSPDGHYLAYSSYLTDEASLAIWDGKTSTSITPTDLSSSPQSYWIAWNPNGQYLAFVPTPADLHRLIYVWDGHTIVNITPKNLDRVPSYYSFSWSLDGRLAFTFQYDLYVTGVRVEGDPGEIYLWDGLVTANLSQNPTGDDQGAVWSADGRLAFLSARNDEYHIFVWDGLAVKNGGPDRNAFAEVAPGMVNYYSFPGWTNNGQLTFVTTGPHDSHAQIYKWDGRQVINISQNPSLHNGSPTWSIDGLWAFATFFSPQQLIYVRNAKNETLLTIFGQAHTWNSMGYLTFCAYGEATWTLALWDKQRTIIIDQGREISAQWQSGSGIGCSSG